MIIVNSPVMQDDIIKTLEASEDPTFTYTKKSGIKLYFETSMDDAEAAAKIAKSLIKEQPFGKAILFSVITQEYV